MKNPLILEEKQWHSVVMSLAVYIDTNDSKMEDNQDRMDRDKP